MTSRQEVVWCCMVEASSTTDCFTARSRSLWLCMKPCLIAAVAASLASCCCLLAHQEPQRYAGGVRLVEACPMHSQIQMFQIHLQSDAGRFPSVQAFVRSACSGGGMHACACMCARLRMRIGTFEHAHTNAHAIEHWHAMSCSWRWRSPPRSNRRSQMAVSAAGCTRDCGV